MSDIPATPPADDSLPALPPEYSACRGSGKARVHQVLIGVYLVLIGKAVVFTWMLFWLILSRVFETSGGLV
ncbi:MAG TPA: hypothetical protein VHM91_08840, partial [Verrucomicrobiales bacterium]|nr:hypothetical protein [Verrucomicrobiales bacterium]